VQDPLEKIGALIQSADGGVGINECLNAIQNRPQASQRKRQPGGQFPVLNKTRQLGHGWDFNRESRNFINALWDWDGFTLLAIYDKNETSSSAGAPYPHPPST